MSETTKFGKLQKWVFFSTFCNYAMAHWTRKSYTNGNRRRRTYWCLLTLLSHAQDFHTQIYTRADLFTDSFTICNILIASSFHSGFLIIPLLLIEIIVKVSLMQAGVSPLILASMDSGFMFTYAGGSFVTGQLGDRFSPVKIIRWLFSFSPSPMYHNPL